MSTETQPTPEPDTGGEVEALAAVIHPHMKGVRDRGDYIVGPASDEAACAILAAGYLSPDAVAAVTREAKAEAWDELHRHVCIDPDGPHMPLSKHANPYRLARTAPLQDAEEVGEC